MKKLPRHLTAYRNGWRYQRAVPTRFQKAVGLRVWQHDLGKISFPDAVKAARRFSAHYDGEIARLHGMSPQERAVLETSGGLRQAAGRQWLLDIAIKELETDHPPDDFSKRMSPAALRRMRADALLTAHDLKALPKVSIPPPATASDLPSLVDLWVKMAAPRTKASVRKMRLYLNRFIEATGVLNISQVTSAHARAFRDALGVSKSADKHLNGVSRLFKVAVSEGIAVSNPFSGVTVLKDPKRKLVDLKPKEKFSVPQAKAILSALDKKLDLANPLWLDFRHIARLMIYHGCRSGELVNVRGIDIVKVQKIWVMRLHDEADDATIKNTSSIREVPIHPACKDFIAYAQTKEPSQFVFDSMPNWSTGRAGKVHQMQTHFFRKVVCIPDKKITLHCARHYWRWLCEEKDVPALVSRSIEGHTLGKDHHDKTYGSPPSLKKRYAWLKELDPLTP